MTCRRVWKTVLGHRARTEGTFDGPNPKPLSVALIGDDLCVWTEHDSDGARCRTTLEFAVMATGEQYDESWIPVGTVLQVVSFRVYVWHVVYRVVE